MLKKRPKSVCKPDPVQPDLAARPDDHSSRPGVAAGLKRPTRPACPEGHESGPLSSVPPLDSSGDGAGPIWPCSGWGLPSRHVTMPLVRSYRTISPLPTGPFGYAFAKPCGRWSDVGGVFSVALSVRSPSLGVTQHPALRSPDFPPVPAPCGIGTGGHPTDFGHHQRNAPQGNLQRRS